MRLNDMQMQAAHARQLLERVERGVFADPGEALHDAMRAKVEVEILIEQLREAKRGAA